MEPKELLMKWIKLFNEGNPIELAELYHDDAVNHQVANNPIEGKEAIRKMFEFEFGQTSMTCIPENIFQDGDWAILEWIDPYGLRGCGFFKIIDDKIIHQRGYWDKLSFLQLHNIAGSQE